MLLYHSQDAMFNKIIKFNVASPLTHCTFPSCLIFPHKPFPKDSLSCSHLNMQLTYYGKRRAEEETVCMHFSITNRIYSRFNVHVFYFKFLRCRPLPRTSSARRCRIERKIVSCLILSVERIMSFLYAFYSTSHS